MSQKLKELLERAETWPAQVQEEAADMLIAIAEGQAGAYKLTDEDTAALERSLGDTQHGRFASEDEVARVFAKYGA